MEIKRVAVLGSGIMGSGIAAHLSGAGIPCYLLDIVPKEPGADRNRLAKAGIEALLNSKPSLIFSKRDARLITPGNFEDDWEKLKECDWVIEVVVERLDIKRQVFERVEQTVRPETIVSSNTSGLSLRSMSEGRSSPFRRNFLVTHFFNPVRYMKLVEVVSSSETDPGTVETMVRFLEQKLGKGVVFAKDTPNFIANRIGVFGWFSAMKYILEKNYPVEAVDKILGPAIGRPKSGMFRTTDMVGVDTLAHIAHHTYESCPNDEMREIYKVPKIVEEMIEKKQLGEKTGQGFYKKVKRGDGISEILVLDWQTGEYRSQQKVRYPSLGKVKEIESSAARLKFFVNQKDEGGELAWKVVRDTLLYSANRIPEIADDIVNFDNGMKWGYNWDLGPFEIWDCLGVKEAVERIRQDGFKIPSFVEAVLQKGEGTFYRRGAAGLEYFDLHTSSYKAIRQGEGVLLLKSIRERTPVLRKNDSASLIDIGDGVLCLEFNSKMNAIDDEICSLMKEGVREAERNFTGMVVANEGENFSVGANLMLLFMAAQMGDWKQIETVLKNFQDACMGLRYSAKPVVAVPFNLALGGGCEVCLGADAIQAHAELYMGLVELGVGLIPAGGGCKEMIRRFDESVKMGPFPKVQRAFETIGFARVSTSAKEAQEIGYMTKKDRISLSRDRLLTDAKRRVVEMAKNYQRPVPREDIVLPGHGGYYAMVSAIEGFRLQGKISEHDEVIAKKLSHILTGGDRPNMGRVSEQKLLDLEREVFLSLCGMEKTQERIQHMLLKGKPLRN